MGQAGSDWDQLFRIKVSIWARFGQKCLELRCPVRCILVEQTPLTERYRVEPLDHSSPQ